MMKNKIPEGSRPLFIRIECPYCDAELSAGDDCTNCGAKYVGNDGGNYCELCESTYYYNIGVPKGLHDDN